MSGVEDAAVGAGDDPVHVGQHQDYREGLGFDRRGRGLERGQKGEGGGLASGVVLFF